MKDCSAAEIISKVADHLAEAADPLQREVLSDALREAFLETVAEVDASKYQDLEKALDTFFAANGVEGLLQSFLTNYVFGSIWMAIESHAQLKAEVSSAPQALSAAVNQVCREHVAATIQDAKASGKFDDIDWFGPQGVQLGNEIIEDLNKRLNEL